jgi:hypothetical protein
VTIFLLIYIDDDIIITSSSSSATTELLHALKGDFALKDLGPLHYFLVVEVTRSADGIHLSQKKYTANLLQRAGMTMCKPAPTPISCLHCGCDEILKHHGCVAVSNSDPA